MRSDDEVGSAASITFLFISFTLGLRQKDVKMLIVQEA